MKYFVIIYGILGSFNFLNASIFKLDSEPRPFFPTNFDDDNESIPPPIDEFEESPPHEKVIELKQQLSNQRTDGDFQVSEEEQNTSSMKESAETVYESEGNIYTAIAKKPCAIVVLSSNQHANVQSLLRKYRYDANGVLIPSSVQYFMKVPQPHGQRSSLIPLTDKAFSPLGGFVRYYKEVPAIPQSWRR